MKVSASVFAIALWAVAAFVFVVQLVRILGSASANASLMIGVIAINLVYVAAIAGLGAIIAVLGDIREQLSKR